MKEQLRGYLTQLTTEFETLNRLSTDEFNMGYLDALRAIAATFFPDEFFRPLQSATSKDTMSDPRFFHVEQINLYQFVIENHYNQRYGPMFHTWLEAHNAIAAMVDNYDPTKE